MMLLMGPILPVPAPQPVMDALTSVQVTTTAGQADGFQLTLALSDKSLLNQVLLPVGYFDPGIRVIVLVILGGLPTVLIDGIITRQDVAPSDTPGASTLTITGEDLSVLMGLDFKQVCYPGLPAEGRVEVILAQYALYGIIPAAVPPVLLDVPDPIDQIPVQSGTDLDHLRALAAYAGYVFFIEPGPLPGSSIAYWGPEVRVGVPQPALNVNMDAETNVESLSFSYDGLARKQLTVTIQEPITGLSIPIPIPDISILRPPLAARPAVTLRHAPLPDTAKLTSVQAALMGLGQGVADADAVTGQGTLDVLRYGYVLQARQLVSVRGAGVSYDGFYYVTSVTHSIKRGEYKQSFQLARDGVVSLTPVVPP
jgi:hypothetical protein